MRINGQTGDVKIKKKKGAFCMMEIVLVTFFKKQALQHLSDPLPCAVPKNPPQLRYPSFKTSQASSHRSGLRLTSAPLESRMLPPAVKLIAFAPLHLAPKDGFGPPSACRRRSNGELSRGPDCTISKRGKGETLIAISNGNLDGSVCFGRCSRLWAC